jgi:serine/threonine protein kinase/tetratricopeptide (TPR) repeat protein
MPADPRRVKELFGAALDLPDASARHALLDRECSDDPELRQRLEVLLAAHNQPGSMLERPLAMQAEPATDTFRPRSETVGTVIADRYKLLELIGEGGMGTVWMAQQTEPVRRAVAVKLVKPGMDTKQVLARFEAERQALALMDHPNIAKVHDAGVTPDGRPFFAMELVKGVPITRYCDEHHLTPRQRLELFVPVCHAIQHAHQKGIIHRDLKPSNVLVALYDDKPLPKIIDFGVAKATGQQLTEQTLHTGFGSVVGTVEYMSPEQARFNNLDIDTRSDIYSLGVLLYELLAGSPPFTRKELEQAGVLEMLRVIREEEPSKPSTKLSTANGLPTLAANRGTEPAKLTRLVRGELDWIVMKALEKDCNRRYETANGFAADVQRYLADEPVQACPPSAWYRLAKFVRRNKVPVIAAGLLFFALVAGVVGTSLGLARALDAEKAARTAEEHERRAKRDLQARMSFEFGNHGWQNGQTEEAEKYFRQAIEIWTQLAADAPDEPAYLMHVINTFLHHLRPLLQQTGRAAELKERFARAVPEWEKSGRNTAHTWRGIGEARLALEQPDQAIAAFSRGIETFPGDENTPHCYLGRSLAYQALKQEEKALADLDRAIELWPKDFDTWAWRGFYYSHRQICDKSISDFNECLKLNPRYWEGWWTRGYAHARLAHWQEAIADYAKAAELNPKKADFHSDRARLLSTCPDAKFRDLVGAVVAATRAVELAPNVARFWSDLGVIQYRAGACKGAVDSLRRSNELLGGKNLASNGFFLAMALSKLGNKDEARRWYEQAVEWMEKNKPKDKELHRFRAEAAALLDIEKKKE